MVEKSIDGIRGSNGKRLSAIRGSNDDLDAALKRPVSVREAKERETDEEIAEELLSHGFNRHDIQKVLHKRNRRDKTSIQFGDGNYIKSVLTEAGMDVTKDYSQVDSDDLTTDSNETVDTSKFSDVKF